MKNKKLNGRGSRLNAVTAADDGSPDIYQRLTRMLLGVFLLGVLILAISFFMPEVDKQKTANAELVALKQTRDAYKRQRDKLQAHLNRLQTNTEYFELFARDRLDLFREGETVFRFEDGGEEKVPRAIVVE